METKKVRGKKWGWTNERHLHFLNSVEASFVQTMLLDQHNNTGTGTGTAVYRMDRYLPDSSDSTVDLKNDQRRRRHSASDIMDKRVRTVDKQSLTCQPYTTHEDQVVPQQVNRREDNEDDNKDLPVSVIAHVAPAN